MQTITIGYVIVSTNTSRVIYLGQQAKSGLVYDDATFFINDMLFANKVHAEEMLSGFMKYKRKDMNFIFNIYPVNINVGE